MAPDFRNILVIQTAFLGDVVIASSLLEYFYLHYPHAKISILVRKGNEGLFKHHPYLHKLWVWNKEDQKTQALLRLSFQIRQAKYDLVINCHRHLSTGIVTLLSGAGQRVGFTANPLSRAFTKRVPYVVDGRHERDRYMDMLHVVGLRGTAMPRLYPSKSDFEKVSIYQSVPYVCIAPASVWFTKQLPADKWAALCNALNTRQIFIIGAAGDKPMAKHIMDQAGSNITSLCGQLTVLQSAALMQKAVMNYTNDSAPMHLCAAMDAPVCAVFCSTAPKFGFGPLSNVAAIVETKEKLPCRPCGSHGFAACPQGHFKCGHTIEVSDLVQHIPAGF